MKRLGINSLNLFSFSVVNKLPSLTQQHARLTRELRSSINIDETIQIVEKNLKEINELGKTVTLEYFNEIYIDPRENKGNLYKKLFETIKKLENLSLYENVLKLSIFEKIIFVFSNQEAKSLLESETEKCWKEIIRIEEEKFDEIDLYHCFSVFLLFRIQKYEHLCLKTLEILDKKIEKFDQNLNLEKTIGLIMHQLNFIPWKILSKYPNVIKFVSNYSNPVINADMDVVVGLFNKMSQLKLHKVGLHKVPVHLYELSTFLKQKNLYPDEICKILRDWCLPASFDPELKHLLKKRLLSTPNLPLAYQKHIPYGIFTTEEIDRIYSKKESRAYLWFQTVYYSNPETSKYFYRGIILEHCKSVIDEKHRHLMSSNKKILGSEKYSQEASRFLFVSYEIYKQMSQKNTEKDIENKEIFRKVAEIITCYFDRFGIYHTVSEFPLTNFFMLFIIFKEEQELSREIKNIFYTVLEKRKNRSKFTNYEENCLLAIRSFIEDDNPNVKECVLVLVNTIFNHEKEELNWESEVYLLIEILNRKENKELSIVKRKLLKKLKNEDFECFLDYFILEERKTFKGLQEITSLIFGRKYPMEKFLQFLSNFSVKELTNYNGKLETQINHYLTNYKKPINFDFNFMREYGKILSILSSFSREGFPKKLYLDGLESINLLFTEKDSIEKYKESLKLLADFVMKFEEVLPENQTITFENQAILEKAYFILRKISSVEENIYIKAKVLEFSHIYRNHVKTNEGLEIENLHYILEKLNSLKNKENYSHIYFILLKLECMNKIKLSETDIIEFSSIIQSAINSGKFSIYRLKNEINSLNFWLKRLNTGREELENLDKRISPIIKLSTDVNPDVIQWQILSTFITFYTRIKQLEKIIPIITKFLSEKYVSTSMIDFLISNIPLQKFTPELTEILIRRCEDISYQYMSNNEQLGHVGTSTFALKLLFHLDKLFFKVPKKYEHFYDKLFTFVSQKMESNIQKKSISGRIQEPNEIVEKEHTQKHEKSNPENLPLKNNSPNKQGEENSYYMGRYPLLMFCCIKNESTSGNSVFEHLAQFVHNNPGDLENKIRDNKLLKWINESILIFLGIGGTQSVHPHNFFIGERTKLKGLEDLLQKEETSYELSKNVHGVWVPCYLPEKQEAIICCGPINASNCSQGGTHSHPLNEANSSYNGLVKFYGEVIKKVFERKGEKVKIRIYNTVSQQFCDF